MKTWHISVEGRVQGVGFRPFIYRLAKEHSLCGTVSNEADGVHIYLNANSSELSVFCESIKSNAPVASLISKLSSQVVESVNFDNFRIVESGKDKKVRLNITPDIAPCSDCLDELNDADDRRFKYSFITCTNCGPRFSIMEALPYDRIRTSMSRFDMCPACEREYDAVDDRRFYSQTNSCPECGISLSWIKGDSNGSDHISEAILRLRQGQILAVKGVGGFLLMCDASQRDSVHALRERKQRPSKPFACLFPDVDSISKIAHISQVEKDTLKSPEAPIVLLETKNQDGPIAMEEIAPGLNRIGVMLPASPLLFQLSKAFPNGLIATSGNLSSSPIIYADENALEGLGDIADAILTYNRDIHFPQDDSVVCLDKEGEQKIIIRRSRGLAPSLMLDGQSISGSMLAMGAEMKSSFGISGNGLIYISQFLGDTSKYESQETYKTVLDRMLKLIKPEIGLIAVDLHPNYHVSQMGKDLGNELSIDVKAYQHHKAHFASVLGENDLLDCNEKVMGVVWDGTGYGEDGNVWGGEFFILNNGSIERHHHLKYYPHLSGNKMATDPRMPFIAASYPDVVDEPYDFSSMEWEILKKRLVRPSIETSSVGRLFDAVGFALGISTENSYEGETAMKVQQMAERSDINSGECLNVFNGIELVPSLLMKEIRKKIKARSKEDLCLDFHTTLVEWIRRVAVSAECRELAFSGGVFQNILLLSIIRKKLGNGFKLYFHRQLSPNDENIAFGQLMLAELEKREKSDNLTNLKSQHHVFSSTR